jgi:hypothetical protein
MSVCHAQGQLYLSTFFMISSVLAEVQTKQLLNTATPTCLVLSVTDSMSTYTIHYTPGVVAAL